MKIRMLKDARGAPHGHTVFDYRAGEVYPQLGFEMTDDLRDAFFDMGVCELAEQPEDVLETAPGESVHGENSDDGKLPPEPESAATRKRRGTVKGVKA